MNGSALATLYPAPTTRFGCGAAGFGLQIHEPLGGMARDYISLITVVLLSCTHPHSSRFVSALFFLNFFSFFLPRLVQPPYLPYEIGLRQIQCGFFYRLLFDATMIATLPSEVCIDGEGEGGLLLSCEIS